MCLRVCVNMDKESNRMKSGQIMEGKKEDRNLKKSQVIRKRKKG